IVVTVGHGPAKPHPPLVEKVRLPAAGRIERDTMATSPRLIASSGSGLTVVMISVWSSGVSIERMFRIASEKESAIEVWLLMTRQNENTTSAPVKAAPFEKRTFCLRLKRQRLAPSLSQEVASEGRRFCRSSCRVRPSKTWRQSALLGERLW